MNLAIKAALFSGLLFPGWGQIYLKKYKRGLTFILPAFIGIVAVCWLVVQAALPIIRAAQLRKGAVDVNAVLKFTAAAMQTLNTTSFSLLVLIIIVLWILSTIDAYFLGKKIMQEKAAITTSADPQQPSLPA